MATGSASKKSTSDKIIVAAMDLGTTYSCCTFSFKDEFNKDPLDIRKPEVWSVSSRSLQSLKAPTVILLNKKKQFVAFGFDAEERYLQLVEDEEHKDYYYFRGFKMNLHTSIQMKKSLPLTDVSGKEVEALTVFSLSIKYLKENLEHSFNRRSTLFKPDDIQWVLTVPAISTDGAKQFMRIAAEMAGIKNENLMLASEPEAASILCMHLPLNMQDQRTKQVSKDQGFPKGTRYMVVIMGGHFDMLIPTIYPFNNNTLGRGIWLSVTASCYDYDYFSDNNGRTVDITVHEVERDGYLKELAPPTGGNWGGTTVDESFINLLKHIVGDGVYNAFAEENEEDVMDLYREFKTKKRTVKMEQEIKKKAMAIPPNLVRTFERMNRGCDVAQRIEGDRKYKGKIIWKNDKFRIDSDILCSFFDTSVEMTIKEINSILSQPSGAGVNTILLVGGYAESPLIQETIRSRFPGKRVVIPDDAGLAVLNGAVIYGHRPTTIISRIARYSYGIRVYRDFVDGQHPPSKLITVGRKKKCKDVFGVHVEKGQELRIGEAQGARRYPCIESDQRSLVFDFYTSTDRNPSFVTDPSCTFIGQLEVMFTGASRGAVVSIIFGGTELILQAEDEVTKEKTKAEFKFLTD